MSPLSDVRLLVDNVRKFTEKEISPYTMEFDYEERLAPGIFKRFGELDILRILCPKEYGGSDLGVIALVAVIEELSYADPGTCLSYVSHAVSFINTLKQYGTHEQKEKYLPLACMGRIVGTLATTETTAGSDILALETSITKKSSKFFINGKKMFITNAPIADFFLVATQFNNSKCDIRFAILSRNTSGLICGKKLNKIGLRSSPTSDLCLDNCEIFFENILGKDENNIKLYLRNFDLERIAYASISLGIARSCLDHSLKYAIERNQFDTSIINFQGISHKIANMYINYRAARSLIYETATLIDESKIVNQETAAAKVFSTEMATKIALDAIQILGGYGCLKDFEVERYARDAKVLEIIGGTNEILRTLISKEFVRKRESANNYFNV